MKGMRYILLAVFLLFVPIVVANTSTEVFVPNSPPVFNGIIPNVSWAGGNLENIFNLNDYFLDLQGDPIIFSWEGETSLEFVIDEGGNVSVISPENYISLDKIIFYAEDEIGKTPSNEVYFGVGVDIEPPQWSNPRKDKSKVYQNDFVNFSADWTDNFGLMSYILFIDQGGGFEEYLGNFSGVENTSTNKVQISAPGGITAKWRICGFDTSSNQNCTEEYDFLVFNKPVPTSPPSSGEGDGSESDGSGAKDMYKEQKDSKKEERTTFSLSDDSFLVELKQGTSLTKVFEITNTGTTVLNFNLFLEGLEEYTLLSTSNFTLGAGEAKTITIDFSSKLLDFPGQYFGSLVVNGSESVRIPIVLTINSAEFDYVVEVNVSELYKSVKPGKDVLAVITVTNLGDKISSEIKVDYAIKDFYGNIYDSGEEVISIQDRAQIEKKLNIPKDVLLGKYIFYARVSNEKDIGIDSDSFVVGLSFRFEAFLKSSSVFLAILILSTISVVLVLRHRKQKEKERALNLYVKLNELKNLIKEKNYDKAASEYISIKRLYGEHVNKEDLENREILAKEIEKLASKINFGEGEEDKVEEGEEEVNSEVEIESNEQESGEESKKKVVVKAESKEENTSVDTKKSKKKKIKKSKNLGEEKLKKKKVKEVKKVEKKTEKKKIKKGVKKN